MNWIKNLFRKDTVTIKLTKSERTKLWWFVHGARFSPEYWDLSSTSKEELRELHRKFKESVK